MVVGAITNLSAMISNGFHSLIQQIGPNYDPLFYDVMVYIFGTILFAVFLLGVISFWLRRKERWTQELEKYFEREQIGLIPDEKHHW
jgi:cbb3-type cytochrome oxidase subunit 3